MEGFIYGLAFVSFSLSAIVVVLAVVKELNNDVDL